MITSLCISGLSHAPLLMDQRGQAFCLSLPMDQFQADGWPRMILRRAMAGLLPMKCVRRDK
jgi:hypothetical protein